MPVPPADPAAVSDARRQLHHAIQVARAPAASYLPPSADYRHTNFGWDAALGAFVSRRVPFADPRRFALRVRSLSLLALDDDDAIVSSLALAGQTLAEAHTWAKAQCGGAGADAARYVSRKPYEIPGHAVVDGAAFGAGAAALESLSTHWDDAVRTLEAVAATEAGASDVRLWAHHFDVGVLLTLDADRSIGLGFTPGDDWYDEPYWYTSPYPAPPASAARPPLGGGGHWHDEEWFSAVLRWSAYADAPEQGAQVAAYLRSALEADHRYLHREA